MDSSRMLMTFSELKKFSCQNTHNQIGGGKSGRGARTLMNAASVCGVLGGIMKSL